MGRQLNDARYIDARHITFNYPGGEPLLSDVSVSVGSKAVGIVGANGCGKSTLLRILSGELSPVIGNVSRQGPVGYLAQMVLAHPTLKVRALFGTNVSGWDAWEVEARAGQALVQLGFDADWLGRDLSGLSGGELTRIRLAAVLAQMPRPQVLLLDEPTNHMDANSRKRLRDFLQRWRGGLVVASHDRWLLDIVEEIWAMTPGGLRVLGGNYQAYEKQRAIEEMAARAAASAAKIALATAREQATEARERQVRRQARGKRQAPNMGLPKILLGHRKRRGEETAARLGSIHDKRVEAATERSREASAVARRTETIRLHLPATHVPQGKVVWRANGVEHSFHGKKPLWATPIEMTVTGPRRIALMGGNGVGKTTLLRLLTNELVPTFGSLMIGVTPWAYLDQRLASLDLKKTVLDLFRDRTPTMTETERRLRLGRLLLGPEHIMRSTETLSGGERMRAALALALLVEPPAKLLLLDEPTNHLDLDSVNCLECALDGYEGALIVVSHDIRFCERLRVDTFWSLDPGGLVAQERRG